MKTRRHLAVFLLLYLSFPCFSQKREIISKSTIKLEGKNTNIRDLINIDGYYKRRSQNDCGDRFTINDMFFEDGTFTGNFFFKEGATKDSIRQNMSKWVRQWIENKQLRWGGYWGTYFIKNDTIIVHDYKKGGFFHVWEFSESRYKVINKTTLKFIYFKIPMKSDENYYRTKSPWKDGATLRFIPADSLPSSDCWLKEEKWIWRNEQDWRDYMEKVKQKKKEYKKNAR